MGIVLARLRAALKKHKPPQRKQENLQSWVRRTRPCGVALERRVTDVQKVDDDIGRQHPDNMRLCALDSLFETRHDEILTTAARGRQQVTKRHCPCGVDAFLKANAFLAGTQFDRPPCASLCACRCWLLRDLMTNKKKTQHTICQELSDK